MLKSNILETESVLNKEVNRAGGQFNPTMHGLRGFATLLVFVFHIFDMSRKVIVLTLWPPLDGAIGATRVGVDIFFMISGYLIMGSLIRHRNVRSFLLDRAFRIYPVFLFLHLLLFTLAPLVGYKMMAGITPSRWFFYFVTNLLLLPGMFNLPLMQLNAWSLSYEAAFYLFSAAVYKLWPRHRNWALVLLFGLASAFIAWYGRPVFFAIGAAIFFLQRGDFAARVWRLPQLGIPSGIAFVCVMGYALMPGHIYWLCVGLPFAFMFFLDVVRQTPPLAALLVNRPMQFLGTISYSFYLWHPVVTFSIRHPILNILMGRWGLRGSYAVLTFGLVALLFTIPVSWLSWMFLEQNSGKWLKRKIEIRGV